jgi:hypothetical protein
MGGAQSFNAATIISMASNSAVLDMSLDSKESNKCDNSSTILDCVVGGNFTYREICLFQVRMTEAVTNVQNSDFKNSLVNKLAQEASSAVSTGALGFADASNAVTAIAKSYNSVETIIRECCSINSSLNDHFACIDSHIGGNLVIDVESKTWAITNQIEQNTETNRLNASIMQDIKQKATATASGFGALLAILLAFILAMVYFFLEPIKTIFSSKIIMTTFLTLVAGVGTGTMYFMQLPPFFNQLDRCMPGSDGDCSTSVCRDCEDNASVYLKQTPLCYAIDIFGNESKTDFKPGLLQMAISNAGGWNDKALNDLNNNTFLQGYPALLKKDNNNCITNLDGWRNFQNSTDPNHNIFTARKALCAYLNIPHDMYIDGHESAKGVSYKFVPSETESELQSYNGAVALSKGGNVVGKFGYVNNASYRLQKSFSTSHTPWLIVGGGFLAILAAIWSKNLFSGVPRET